MPNGLSSAPAVVMMLGTHSIDHVVVSKGRDGPLDEVGPPAGEAREGGGKSMEWPFLGRMSGQLPALQRWESARQYFMTKASLSACDRAQGRG